MKDSPSCFDPIPQKPYSTSLDFESQTVHQLMPFKVREILLVSSLYDAFIIEEEGLISEMVIGEYRDLQLSSPPRVTRVKSGKEALSQLQKKSYDLIITMSKNIGMDPFVFGEKIKSLCAETPVFLLATDTADLVKVQKHGLSKHIDASFYWVGDSKLFLALIKLLEDKINAPYDINNANVRVLILVEDSIRYYSMFLPLLYSEIVQQTERSISEDVNELQRLLRRRARPKILLATTFEEAMALNEQYGDNVIGIISDVGFFHKGKKDPSAGFSLIEQIRKKNPFLPILMQSAFLENKLKAVELDAVFLHKHSPHLLQDIHQFLLDHLGFGDFVFVQPVKNEKTKEVESKELGRASTMEEFEKMMHHLPLESIQFHAQRNDFSNWLLARGEFTLAKILQKKSVSDFTNLSEVRAHLLHVFNETRRKRQLGVITDFSLQTFEFDSTFTRIGNDSLGGKGRGIAFIRKVLHRFNLQSKFDDVDLIVPNTVAIATDYFDQFMKENDLVTFFEKTSVSEKEIAHQFLLASLPAELKDRLKIVLQNFTKPLAVRSSSLLEDSQNHPFAGLYSTYMIPNNHHDDQVRLTQLCNAIKLVYASVFYRDARQYISSTAASTEEEKMAVIIQELIGKQYGKYFYPTLSGVAQSYNYYPVGRQKSTDGIVNLAVGLGTAVVGGEHVIRFCPKYPQVLPDFSTADQILENTQNIAYVLDVSSEDVILNENENLTLEKKSISEIVSDRSLDEVVSHFDHNDARVRDGFSEDFPNLVTFANLLKYPSFSFPELLQDLLWRGEQAMGCPVEMEFAVNLPSDTNDLHRPEFAILQIRPLIVSKEQVHVSLKDISKEDVVIKSEHALGHGVYKDIKDVVIISPSNFDASKTIQIANEIDEINTQLSESKKPYLLIGPGRFGTQDQWLGVPVKWAQISGAKIIVETDLSHFKVKPSQGTHFLQNITAQGIGYLHISYGRKEEFIDWNFFEKSKPVISLLYVQHLQVPTPFTIKINGKNGKAVIIKPSVQKS